MTLREFLRLPHKFVWGGMGGDDCTTFCATWIEYQTGVDPAAGMRGTYDTEEGAHAILADAGGLVPFMASHLEPLGYFRTDDPADGDIGVVMGITHPHMPPKEVSGIRFGPLWAVLTAGCVRATKLETIAAWRRPA